MQKKPITLPKQHKTLDRKTVNKSFEEILDRHTLLEEQGLAGAVEVLVNVMPGIVQGAKDFMLGKIPNFEDLVNNAFCGEESMCGPGMQCSDAHGCKEHRDTCPTFTCSDIHHCSQSTMTDIPFYQTEVWQFYQKDLLVFLKNSKETLNTQVLINPPIKY